MNNSFETYLRNLYPNIKEIKTNHLVDYIIELQGKIFYEYVSIVYHDDVKYTLTVSDINTKLESVRKSRPIQIQIDTRGTAWLTSEEKTKILEPAKTYQKDYRCPLQIELVNKKKHNLSEKDIVLFIGPHPDDLEHLKPEYKWSRMWQLRSSGAKLVYLLIDDNHNELEAKPIEFTNKYIDTLENSDSVPITTVIFPKEGRRLNENRFDTSFEKLMNIVEGTEGI